MPRSWTGAFCARLSRPPPVPGSETGQGLGPVEKRRHVVRNTRQRLYCCFAHGNEQLVDRDLPFEFAVWSQTHGNTIGDQTPAAM